MKTKDQQLLEEAYKKVNKQKLLNEYSEEFMKQNQKDVIKRITSGYIFSPANKSLSNSKDELFQADAATGSVKLLGYGKEALDKAGVKPESFKKVRVAIGNEETKGDEFYIVSPNFPQEHSFDAYVTEGALYINEEESSPFGWLAEAVPHLKKAFELVEGVGYSGDGASEEQINAVVSAVLSPGQWGAEADKAAECLKYVISGLIQIGLQDS